MLPCARVHDRYATSAPRKVCASPVSSGEPRGTLPIRRTQLLLVHDAAAAVLLTKRPPAGIWGGLWSLPECNVGADIAEWCRRRLGVDISEERRWPVQRHTFSHFHLDIHPVVVHVASPTAAVMDDTESVWYNPQQPQQLGLAAPIQRLLNQLTASHI